LGEMWWDMLMKCNGDHYVLTLVTCLHAISHVLLAARGRAKMLT
jgi:hypothetical protein